MNDSLIVYIVISWLNAKMDTKELVSENSTETLINTNFKTELVKRKISGRVDINELMFKVREKQKQQKKENLVFLGLVSSVVLITGIIASL
jgi:hypothetical protein